MRQMSSALVFAATVACVTALTTTTYPRCARAARPGPAARAALQHVRLAMDEEDEVSMGAPPKWQSIRPVDENYEGENYDYEEEDDDEEDDEDDEPVVKKAARQIGLGDSTVNAA